MWLICFIPKENRHLFLLVSKITFRILDLNPIPLCNITCYSKTAGSLLFLSKSSFYLYFTSNHFHFSVPSRPSLNNSHSILMIAIFFKNHLHANMFYFSITFFNSFSQKSQLFSIFLCLIENNHETKIIIEFVRYLWISIFSRFNNCDYTLYWLFWPPFLFNFRPACLEGPLSHRLFHLQTGIHFPTLFLLDFNNSSMVTSVFISLPPIYCSLSLWIEDDI